MPFLMVRNDITKVYADAIVNPANEYLMEGSGTSKAIYQAAGEEKLIKACTAIGHCDLGKAVITDAFNLYAKYIIHAVCPIWHGGNRHESDNLFSAYMESLNLATKYGCESIAFPLLSSGNYGYPKDKAIKVAISAISEFLIDNELFVYIVLYDRDSLFLSKKLFESIEEYIDDNYVQENDEYFESSNLSRAMDHVPAQLSQQRSYSRPQPKSSDNYKPKRMLDSLVHNLDETFTEMLLRLIDEKELKDSMVYKKANVDRRHFSKIRNDVNYTPTKRTVVSFIIALELSMDEAIDLMNKAGFAFSKSSKFDVIISYFIENKNYDIFEINEVLYTYEQTTLGE